MLWRKMVALLATVCVVLVGFSGVSWATHGEVHGYCKDGQPVIQEWPDKYKDRFHAECAGDIIVVVANEKLGGGPPIETMPEPEDFYSWAYVELNGRSVINPYRDIDPFVKKSTGRTLIPIRMVTEAMGGTADWNNDKQQVTIRLLDKYMVMTIGQAEAVANGKPVTLDQPPMLIRDRTMVPLRVLLEAFGATVKWTQETRQIDIELAGVTCAPGYCR